MLKTRSASIKWWLGLTARVYPVGTLEIEGTFDVNVLPNAALVAFYCSAWAQVMSIPPASSTMPRRFLPAAPTR